MFSQLITFQWDWRADDYNVHATISSQACGSQPSSSAPPSTSSEIHFPRILQRSDSLETIRPSHGVPPPSPLQQYRDLSPEPDLNELSSTCSSPGPDNHILLRESSQIQDEEPVLDWNYDLKTIKKDDLRNHLIFRRIKRELIDAAHRMAQLGDKIADTELFLPRYIEAMCNDNLPVIGDRRKSFVALLNLIALESGIRVSSAIKLEEQWPLQKKMYMDVAAGLETEMRDTYEREQKLSWHDKSARARRRG